MTVEEVLNPCWNILNDEDEPHIFYPIEKMVFWVNEAVNQIVRKRPDCLIQTDGTLRTITAVEDLTDALSVDDRWQHAVTEWVLYRAFDMDADDRRDKEQAQSHLAGFKVAVGE